MGFYGMSLIRLLLSLVALLPPVFAIGGTIPLVSKYFLTTSQTLGSKFSRIYYVNTIGAFAGVILTGFVFVKYFGVFVTLMIAVILNLIIVAIIYVTKTKSNQTTENAESAKAHSPYSYMLTILFLTGFISLSYEILWTRILSTYGVATSQSFALILSGFLLGFALGSYVISKKIDSLKNLKLSFGGMSILTAISGALVLFVFQRFELLTLASAKFFNIHTFKTSLCLAFAVSLIPAIFMGMLFPLGLRIYSNDINEIGIKVGKVFLFNTLGSVIGSLFAGFVLVPFVGMWNTTLILVNLSLVISLYMFSKSGKFTKNNLALLLLVFFIVNIMVFSDNKFFHRKARGYNVIYYSEGLSGTVTVLEKDDIKGLVVDSQYVAGTDPVLTIDSKMLGHLPLLLSDNPKRALTVGYGAGGTSYSMLLYGVEVYALEIEEKVVDASYLFKELNFNSHENPRLHIILDDARNYINSVDNKFDVIVTDVTNLKYKRNPYLYTKEYFKIAKAALNENGIAAAWLPISGLSFNDLKILINTFEKVYPHTTVWYFTQYLTHFVIVIGTPEEIEIDLNKLAINIKQAEQDLESIHVDNEYELANMLLLGENDVKMLISGQPIHTDDFPILEFSDMDLYMRADMRSNLKKLLNYQKEELSNYFVGNNSQINLLKKYFKAAKTFHHNYTND
jgi:spermidine synthase